MLRAPLHPASDQVEVSREMDEPILRDAPAPPPPWPRLEAGRIVTERAALERYEIPERGTAGHTDCALLPGNETEVALLLHFCSEHRQPLVVSAGRTGLVEAQRPEAEAVLSLEGLSRPLALSLTDGRKLCFDPDTDPAATLYAWWHRNAGADDDAATLTVEAGMAVDAVNELAGTIGMLWPMELGSSSAASVGGCIANASAGANAIRYGTAAHLCERASGFWADGEPAGPFHGPRWQAPDPERLAIDSTRIDPDWGLIGSQGLFGVITQASLRLRRRPVAREGVLVPVPDMPAAMRLLVAAQRAFPDAVEEYEFIGLPALECVLEYLGDAVRLPFARDRLQPWCVLLQVEADQPEGLAERLYDFLSTTAGIDDGDIGYAPLPVLKRIRHSITESSNARMRAHGGGRLSFDTAVPRARFGGYLDALSGNLARDFPEIELLAFGHAGVGGAHLHLIGTRQAPIATLRSELVARVFDLTASFGGTFSAEHGVGPKWAAEFCRRAPKAQLARLRAEKTRRDPAGILNPRSFGLLNT